tara:strand:- start:672 stop:1244 length:573 start_codon:yes stop_codon:yes gene_type:complete
MSNNDYKPFVFFQDYIRATPDGFSCDYREVTHKIPEYHTMIDPRTNQERKGIFIPAGDIQIECWFNPVDPSAQNYQEWHADNMKIIIKEVDQYNRSYCDNQKKKNYENKKPNKEVYVGFEKVKNSRSGSPPHNSMSSSASSSNGYSSSHVSPAGGSSSKGVFSESGLDEVSRAAAQQFIDKDDPDNDIPF